MPEDVVEPEELFRGFPQGLAICRAVQDAVSAIGDAGMRVTRTDRFTEAVHPSAKVWMHHLELREPAEVDDEVVGWLTEACAAAS